MNRMSHFPPFYDDFLNRNLTLRLRIIAKSAILGTSIEKLLPIYQRIDSGMNVKVSDIIQYYAYKIIDVLD